MDKLRQFGGAFSSGPVWGRSDRAWDRAVRFGAGLTGPVTGPSGHGSGRPGANRETAKFPVLGPVVVQYEGAGQVCARSTGPMTGASGCRSGLTGSWTGQRPSLPWSASCDVGFGFMIISMSSGFSPSLDLGVSSSPWS